MACERSVIDKWCARCGVDQQTTCPAHEFVFPANNQRMKADGGKSNPLMLEVDLARALEVVNRVLDYGFEKYEARGGWKDVGMDRYDAAARRHRRDRDKGELTDCESGLVHLAHEATNLLFQLETYIKENPGMDFLTYNPPPKAHIHGSNQNERGKTSRSV